MQNDALLNVSHIDVFHGTFQALWDVSLTVKEGEIVALIGANTSGKSTLLDTISGFLHPRKGKIEFEGRDITRLEPYKIVDIGITQVPEGRRIFPEMSVLNNLTVGAYSRKAKPQKGTNFEQVYGLFPVLKSRRDQLARTLSGGEQQMLVIGRGLMSSPRLMLLDEMSLGLAPLVLNELYKALKNIREKGVTILFVEQNVRRSLVEGDRAYILESGRIVLGGNARELIEEEKVKKAYFGV